MSLWTSGNFSQTEARGEYRPEGSMSPIDSPALIGKWNIDCIGLAYKRMLHS